MSLHRGRSALHPARADLERARLDLEWGIFDREQTLASEMKENQQEHETATLNLIPHQR